MAAEGGVGLRGGRAEIGREDLGEGARAPARAGESEGRSDAGGHALLERAGAGDVRRGRRAGEAMAQGREAAQEIIEPGISLAALPEKRDVDTLRADGRDVRFDAPRPVHFDEVAPGSERKMPPQPEAAPRRR